MKREPVNSQYLEAFINDLLPSISLNEVFSNESPVCLHTREYERWKKERKVVVANGFDESRAAVGDSSRGACRAGTTLIRCGSTTSQRSTRSSKPHKAATATNPAALIGLVNVCVCVSA